ncbi:hypothetical protein O181_095103 [Austropuccinia psidii MF-1]|uniref:Uncharacterized protein n=1 Tax=Austropuccinia psidii MF-1 TaxID=1389203 RepID=A0A9Q3J4F1_9BASI|nr:hypothetical protein [Austropuccinia psidii MF-1]
MCRGTRAFPKKKVHRAKFHRRVHQCTRRHCEKDKDWQKMEEAGHKRLKNTKELFKTNNTKEKRKFNKCGGIGHLVNNGLKKAKINENVETEDHKDKEEEYDSGGENEEP